MGLVTALGVAGFAVAWVAWPDGPIGPASCERIHQGMELGEVETILGGPEGCYTSDGRDWSMGMLHNGVRPLGHHRRVWVGDDGGIRVDFDPRGRVHVAQWCPRGGSFWDRLRARLRL